MMYGSLLLRANAIWRGISTPAFYKLRSTAAVNKCSYRLYVECRAEPLSSKRQHGDVHRNVINNMQLATADFAPMPPPGELDNTHASSLILPTRCIIYSIFGKVGRTASEEVVLHLVKYKCMPILLYGFEALNLNKYQLNSLDFVANRFMMKLFNTNNMQIIEFCCEQFNFILPGRQIANRHDKFIKSESQRTNLLTFINM